MISKVVLIGNFPEEKNYSMDRYFNSVFPLMSRMIPSEALIPKYRNFFPYLSGSKQFFLNRMVSLLALGIQLSLQNKKSTHYHISDHSYGLLAFFLRKKCTVVCHDLIPLTPESRRMHPGFHPSDLFFKISVHCMRYASSVISVSHYTKSDIQKFLPAVEEITHVSYEGISDGIVYCRETPADLIPYESSIKLIHVGTNHERKNLPLIFQTMKILKEKGYRVVLSKIGSEFNSAQKKLVNDLGISENILFKGNLTDDELSKYYSASDFLIFPSLYEGFGFPVIEAMKCGCAAAALKRTSVTELIENIGIGIDEPDAELFAEAVEKYWNLPEELEKLKRESREYAEKFQWEDHVSDILKLILK